jgi:hypothetical protein
MAILVIMYSVLSTAVIPVRTIVHTLDAMHPVGSVTEGAYTGATPYLFRTHASALIFIIYLCALSSFLDLIKVFVFLTW